MQIGEYIYIRKDISGYGEMSCETFRGSGGLAQRDGSGDGKR